MHVLGLRRDHFATPESGMQQSRQSDLQLADFVEELSNFGSISWIVNGEECDMDLNEWFTALSHESTALTTVRKQLSIPTSFKLYRDDINKYGIIHSTEKLSSWGENKYQKWFDDKNVGKRSCFLLGTSERSGKIPIAQQCQNDTFSFTAKIDNISTLRPLGIEFKGDKTGSQFEVLLQSIRRIYSISCIQQYLGNIGVFAVCPSCIRLVWYERKMVQQQQQQSINVINIKSDQFSYVWALLTKQALDNRDIMYVNNWDAYYLVNFLNSIYPKLAHYCRSRFIKMSMNSVYAITLPQLMTERGKSTMRLSKKDKHFALKVIPSQSEFDQEVACIAKINSHIDGMNGGDNEYCGFYAFGSKQFNGNYQSHSSNRNIVNFDCIKEMMRDVFKEASASKASASSAQKSAPARQTRSLSRRASELSTTTSSATTSAPTSSEDPPQPWWLYQPGDDPSSRGGVIVMICGDLNNKVTLDCESDVAKWLKLYHDARVLHRDIRQSNIVRFKRPPLYQSAVSIADRPSNSCSNNNSNNNSNSNNNNSSSNSSSSSSNGYEYQLIDFNLACCLDDGTTIMETTLQRGGVQWENASFAHKGATRNTDGSVTVNWSAKHDDEMFQVLKNKLPLGQQTSPITEHVNRKRKFYK